MVMQSSKAKYRAQVDNIGHQGQIENNRKQFE